jgi:hypothetical protein
MPVCAREKQEIMNMSWQICHFLAAMSRPRSSSSRAAAWMLCAANGLMQRTRRIPQIGGKDDARVDDRAGAKDVLVQQYAERHVSVSLPHFRGSSEKLVKQKPE